MVKSPSPLEKTHFIKDLKNLYFVGMTMFKETLSTLTANISPSSFKKGNYL